MVRVKRPQHPIIIQVPPPHPRSNQEHKSNSKIIRRIITNENRRRKIRLKSLSKQIRPYIRLRGFDPSR